MSLKISGKGIEQRGTDAGVAIRPQSGNTGFAPFPQVSNTTGLTFTITPGFQIQVSGSTFCTGSLPDASLNMGSMVNLMLTNDACFITGVASSASMNIVGNLNIAAGCVFALNNAAKFGSTLQYGNGLTMPTSGAICLMSDGRVWQTIFATGSITLVR